jgi:uncharacterized OB-fold protein
MTSQSAVAPPVQAGLLAEDPPALLGGGCAACGRVHFPRRPVCPDCQAADVTPARLATVGTIYTFTIVQSRPPGYIGPTPYAFGIVELADDLRVTTTLIADPLESLEIGDRVRFELITLQEGDADAVSSFAFRKVSA